MLVFGYNKLYPISIIGVYVVKFEPHKINIIITT